MSNNSTETDNILDNSTTTEDGTAANPDDDVPVVQQIDNGVAYGYQCAKVVSSNTVTDIDLTFFLDLGFPTGTEDLAINFMQEQLVDAVSLHYGVSSGARCDNPLLDGSTWLVQFLSKTTDWTREELFASCRELSFDASTHECYVYQAIVTGSVLDGNMADVMDFMQEQMEGTALTVNSPYSVSFLAVPTQDPGTGDEGRDNLDEPSNVDSLESGQNAISTERRTITIVGGFLVAAFCFAFIGMGLVFWKRRQQWIVQRDMHLDLDKPHNDGTDPEDELENYDGQHGSGKGQGYGHETISTALSPSSRLPEEPASTPSSTLSGTRRYSKSPHNEDGGFSNNIHFDLGTSFKDQLMGVHGAGGGRHPARGGPYGMGRPYTNSDAASDSDADSWAQTDGTIGSLELQLEPITAEV